MDPLSPDQFRRLREIFEGALEQPVAGRRAWLERACSGDSALVNQVERMLSVASDPHHLLDRSADGTREAATGLCPACAATVTPSHVFCPSCGTSNDPAGALNEPGFRAGALFGGRFQIVALQGRGGMGQVYRAYDLELGQPVALKFLSRFRADSRARARLRTEVRLARQISHPHVCRVYDIGEAGGELYLSMEYVDGEDLATSLKRVGRIPALDAIEIARGICSGLAAAHVKGVLHRDLKPGNIMIDTRGEVRIMDFGLAAQAAQPLDTAEVRSGTPAYMAPEQLAGRAATPRSDIYALGLVLFELFTGRQPFEGGSAADFLRARCTPPSTAPSTLVPGLSPAIDRTILRCLEPDPHMRPASALEVETSLRGSGSDSHVGGDLALMPNREGSLSAAMTVRRTGGREIGEPILPSSASIGARRVWVGLRTYGLWAGPAVAAILVSVTAAAWLWLESARSNAALAALSNVQVQPLTLDGRAMLGTISPDGRFLVYLHATEWDIRVRSISSETDVRLVEPRRFSRVSSLTVTPDGQSVDVVAVTGTTALPDVWRVRLLGGNPQRLLRNVVSAIGWSPDGQTMAFLRTGAGSDEMTVVLANADGSNPRELTTRRAPKVFYSDLTTRAGRPPSRPAWSPDGESLVLTGYSPSTFHEFSELVVLDARTGAERRTVPMTGGWSEVAWLDDTRWLLIGGERPGNVGASGLWVSDASGHQLTPLTREFGFFMNLSVTADRTTAVARRFSVLTGIWISGGSGLDATNVLTESAAGAALPSIDSTGGLTYTAFKSDGVVAVYRLPRGASTPLQIVDRTYPPFAGRFYDVSPDGQTIVYTEVETPHGLFRVQGDGSERVRLENDARLPRLTPDGKTVLFTRSRRPGIYSVPTSGGAVRQLTDRAVRDGEDRPSYRGAMSVSPDGRRLLFNTDHLGVVAVCDLPDCQNMKELQLPSTSWAPDSLGVAYLQNATSIMEQPLDGGSPRALARVEGTAPIVDFRWSPDGSRLVTSRGRHPNDMVIIRRVR